MRIALVTGASRGVGRGVATGLAEAGFRVYATGRGILAADLPGSAVRIRCDHLRDADTEAVFARIRAETDSLDVLVNAAWGGYESMVEDGRFTWPAPFWEQPAHRWTGMLDAGVRGAFVCSAHAAGIMVLRRSGLIVNIGYWAARKYMGNVIYGVAVVSLYPGLVRTEAVIAAAKGWLDLSNSESPEFIGRVVAALARDPGLMARTGKVAIAAEVAVELGVTDVDGRQPAPLTLETA
jgi:NAD(P)-dependent dehydrogenase (short-subunit alcohol dehydrogenase family)